MKNLKVISLGLGQQSTTIYYMSSLGLLPKADFAIFADPGAESKLTYDYLTGLLKWQEKNDGIPIIATGKKSIYTDLILGLNSEGNRFSSIPAFTKDENGKIGMLRRQCTDDYKVQEVNNAIRQLYGLKKYARTPKTEIWIGISIDEIQRMKFPRHKWQTYVYPLCNYRSTKKEFHFEYYTTRLNRNDCQHWLINQNLPIPPKSSCIFCPYQANRSWLDMKKNRPDEWNNVVELDKKIRNSSKKGVHHPIYLHRSCIPLDQADLQENQLDMFINECEGFCGI